MKLEEQVNTLLSVLPEKVGSAVYKSVSSGEVFEEIRLRRERPVMVTQKGKSFFLSADGRICGSLQTFVFITSDELQSTLLKICDNSVFAHTKEIENGYISARGGVRVGISGDFSPSLAGINSVNIRIPRQIKGCADCVFPHFSGGMLLAGPPGSGKTTMLRDLIRRLSDNGARVCVIDSRREISGGEESTFDLGYNTDVSFTEDKAFGALCALRTMYPQIIAFDEIGTADEVHSILEAFNAGVYILTTAHAGSISELKKRPVTRRLIESNTILNVAMLSKNIGEMPQIYSTEEILSEVFV